jgi:tRNA-specific 2-thiouridylase
MDQKKAMIAMSGGVDSSVAAFLMQQEGFDCCGGTLLLCDASLTGVPTPSPADDARLVAERLQIPFYTFDAREEFRQAVAEPFVVAYEQGLTPNPCIFCNQKIKFSLLLEKALSLGCSHIVTGHYARICKDEETGRYLLYKAPDKNKDQSYFLAGLTQYQLSHCRFPLGELTKEQVRAIAEEQGFITARKKDSQDICFIPGGDYVAFMERYRGQPYPEGAYLDISGKEVGRHKGAVGYTLGQRKGLGLAMGAPVYVCAKDMLANTVTVGPEQQLFATTLIAENWNFLPFENLEKPITVYAKARYRHEPQPATVYPMENGKAKVIFQTPQRAITPGQAVVLYDGDMVVGSGTITQVEK